MNIADLFVSLKLDAGGVQEGLKGVLADLKAVAAAVPSIGININGLDQVTAKLKEIGDQLQKIAGQEIFGPFQQKPRNPRKPKPTGEEVYGPFQEVFGPFQQKPSKQPKQPKLPKPPKEEIYGPFQRKPKPPRLPKAGEKPVEQLTTLQRLSAGLKSLFGKTLPNKTKQSIKLMGSGLKSLVSLSFEAKVALVGALYAFQQLVQTSNVAGTSLKNFSALTGVSAQTLQKYQYAGRQVGVTNEEMQSTFESLQDAMTKIHMGQGAPAGFAQFAKEMGGITKEDVDEFMKNPELLLLKLQDYAQREKRVGIRNQVLGSFVGKGVSAALSQNAFRSEVLAKAPTYSDKEINTLSKVAAMWSNLRTQIDMAVGRFNAAHGDKLASIFKTLVDLGLQFAGILLKIADRFYLFDGLSKAFDGIKEIFSFLFDAFERIVPILGQVATYILKVATDAKLFDSVKNLVNEFINVLSKLADTFFKVGTKFTVIELVVKVIKGLIDGLAWSLNTIGTTLDKLTSFYDKFKELTSGSNLFPDVMSVLGIGKTASNDGTETPRIPSARDVASPNMVDRSPVSQSFNLQQSLNFGNITNPKEAGNVMKSAVNDAFRQLSAQTQRN